MVSRNSRLPSLPPRVHWPIVGREDDISLLVKHLAEGSSGVVVMGGAGLGKSTVVARALDELTAQKCTVLKLPAPQERGRSVSFIELWLGIPVASGTTVDLVAEQVMATISASCNGQAPILGVDDLHLVDTFSASVLGRLVQSGQVRLVGTAREVPGLPDAVDSLWRSGHLDRMDLVPLSYESVLLILRAALPGPASNDMAYRLWQATAGNPLHVRELLYSIVAAGDVLFAEHAWIWTAPLRTNRRLIDLLASDIGSLDGPARDVVDLVALAEAVPVNALAPSANDEVLRSLVERGLIAISEGPGPASVAIGHPLYAETLRSLLFPRRKRELFDLMPQPQAGSGSHRDLPRWVEWALECGVTPEVGALLGAGADLEALSLPERGVPLVALALDQDRILPEERIEALLLRARLNRDAGWTDRAEADLALLAPLVGTTGQDRAWADGITVKLARIRADIVQMHHRDLDGALEGLAATAKALDPGGTAAVELAVEQLGRLGHGGRHAEILAGWGPQRAAAEHPANLSLAPSYIYALAQSGRPVEAKALAEAGLREVGPEHAQFPLLRTALLAARVWAAIWAGMPHLTLSHPDFIEDGIQRHDAVIYQTGAGCIYLVFGSWDLAVDELRGALTRMKIGAPSNLEALAWAGLAQAHAVRGERELSWEAIAAYTELAPGMNRSVEVDSRYRVLLAQYALGEEAMAEKITDYLEWAGAGNLALGVLLGRHLRLVQAKEQEREGLLIALARAAVGIEGLLPEALLGHARALIAKDAGMLSVATAQLNAVGIWITTPLQRADLTRRQREIAELAGAGMPNKAIAQKLQLSVRTVDTHMGHILARMGVSRRTELATVLTGQI